MIEAIFEWLKLPFRVCRELAKIYAEGWQELNCMVAHRKYHENTSIPTDRFKWRVCDKCQRMWLGE